MLFELVQHVALVTMLERGEEEASMRRQVVHAACSKGAWSIRTSTWPGSKKGCCPPGQGRRGNGDPARAAESLATLYRGRAPPDVRGHRTRPAQLESEPVLAAAGAKTWCVNLPV